MRHYFAAGAVTAGARGMKLASARAALVAPTRRLQAEPARPGGAFLGAVALATVTVAADHRLAAAARAEEQTGGARLGPAVVAPPAWTAVLRRGILIVHACPARCGGTTSVRSARSEPAPCLPPFWQAAPPPSPASAGAAASARRRCRQDCTRQTGLHRRHSGRAGIRRFLTAVHRRCRSPAPDGIWCCG